MAAALIAAEEEGPKQASDSRRGKSNACKRRSRGKANTELAPSGEEHEACTGI